MDDAQALQQPRIPGPGAGRPDGAPAEQPAAQPEALPAATPAASADPTASPPADDADVAADADGAAAEDDDAASQQGGGARQRKARRPMRPFPPAQQESGLSTLVDRLNDTICTMHLRCGVEVHVVIVRTDVPAAYVAITGTRAGPASGAVLYLHQLIQCCSEGCSH